MMTTARDFIRGVNPGGGDLWIRKMDSRAEQAGACVPADSTKSAAPDITRLMAFEEGELSLDDTIQLFQELVDSGLVWKLQGTYGRFALRLVELGLVGLPVESKSPLDSE